LTESYENLIKDIIQTHELFEDYNPERILVCFGKTRIETHFGKKYIINAEAISLKESIPIIKKGVSVFYLLRFRFPACWNGSFKRRLVTVFHELFHISPASDGSFRDLPSKVSLWHGNSHKVYNYFMGLFVNQYLEWTTNPTVYEFMKHSLDELLTTYQSIDVRCVRKKRNKDEWNLTITELRSLLS